LKLCGKWRSLTVILQMNFLFFKETELEGLSQFLMFSAAIHFPSTASLFLSQREKQISMYILK
jgi:hypothetical protein